MEINREEEGGGVLRDGIVVAEIIYSGGMKRRRGKSMASTELIFLQDP